MDTRELTAALSVVLDRADTTGDAVVTADAASRWPTGAADQLEALGLLVRATNERGMTCDGCEDGCWVEPELRHRADGSQVLVHACEHREDIGLVELDAGGLVAWRLNFAGIATALAASLGLNRSVDEIAVGRTWRLGERRIHGRRQTIFFGYGLTLDDGPAVAAQTIQSVPADDVLLLVPSRKPAPQIWPRDLRGVITFADAIDVSSNGLVLRLEDFAPSKPSKRKISVRPFPTPAGIGWDKVVIRILDGDRAELVAARKKETRTFAEMGMRDSRKSNDESTAAWAMLLILASNAGELSWGDQGASVNARTHMKLLRTHLRELFAIEDDPINDYKSKRRWKTKFTLVDLRTDR
jgi:hypothetical protein